MLDQLKALVQLETFRTFSKSNIVVNGESVNDIERHPWLVALRTNGNYQTVLFWGTVLNNSLVLVRLSRAYKRLEFKILSCAKKWNGNKCFDISGGSHFCGGAILDRHHILTAAHCDFSQLYDRIVYRTVHRYFSYMYFCNQFYSSCLGQNL